MIITTRRHGRNRGATNALLAHLSKARGQSVEIAMISNTIASEPRAALRLMERARDAHARAEVAYHHLTISPTLDLSEHELREAVARVLDRLGASENAHVVWTHKKPNEPAHYHTVLGHVGPSGRCINDSKSFTRLEAASRSLEVAFGERLTHSRRTAEVAELLAQTEPEVAAAIRAAVPEDERPRSSMRSSTRALAERLGFDLPATKTKIRALGQQSDSPRAALAALADARFSVEPGEKARVFVVKSGDFTVGALDRLVGRKRAEIAAAMAQAWSEKERKREPEREHIVTVENPDDDRKGREPRHCGEARNRGDALDRKDDLGAAPAATRRISSLANDGVDFDRPGGPVREGRQDRSQGEPALATLTPAGAAEIARTDRDPRTSELAERAARLAQPPQSLTSADLVEVARVDADPRASDLAARAARLAQPSQELTPADLVEIAHVDRDPLAVELAARAARLAQPAQMLTPAEMVEIAHADHGPHAVELAVRAARLAQPPQSLTPADLVEVARVDADPRAFDLAARAARLAQPALGLTPADLVEIAQAERDPRAIDLAMRAAQLTRILMLDRREIRARDVLARSFAPPPAPAVLTLALAKSKQADEVATLARAVEDEAQIALEQHRARRRPGRLFGWLTGARRQYDTELRTKQEAAEMRSSQRQRADVVAVIARESARRLMHQQERAAASARDADERRRDQARAQLRWCVDARIALRDFPDLAAKNIRTAIAEVRRSRERLEEMNYNSRNRATMVPRC